MVALCVEAARKKCEAYWPPYHDEPIHCDNGIKVDLLKDFLQTKFLISP